MKHNLYFRDSRHKRREIGEAKSIDEAMNIIHEFLKQYPNFTSYYTRIYYKERVDETWFDVGSHTEFFVATGKLEGVPE